MTEQYASEGQIEKLMRVADEYWALITTLDEKKELVQGTALETEYNSTMEKGWNLRNKIDSIKTSIDTAGTWIAEQWENATDSIKATIGLNGLGALPLVIPIAATAVTASIAAMTKWITDATQLNMRINAMEKLIVEEGVSPQEAARLVQAQTPATTGTGFLSNIFPSMNQTKNLVIAGGVVFFLLKWKKII